MSKRKLTEKQTKTIRSRQQAYSETAAEQSHSVLYSGIVISRFGKHADVETLEEKTITRCHLRTNLESVVTGDRVLWEKHSINNQGVIVSVMPRHSEITRTDSRGLSRAIAANIDQIIIVIAPNPPAHSNLIDRYIVAAEASHIKPVLLLNKTDLISTDDQIKFDNLLSIYESLQYPTIRISTKTGEGLQNLKNILAKKTSIFVGQSGVGKSSLVNLLSPNAATLVGELSEGTDKGTHTTTASRLFHLKNGGDLIDSPGIREFHLTHLDKSELMQYFVEMRSFLGHCRFRNCTHANEPDCAIQAALSDGKINPERMQNYLHIYQSLSD